MHLCISIRPIHRSVSPLIYLSHIREYQFHQVKARVGQEQSHKILSSYNHFSRRMDEDASLALGALFLTSQWEFLFSFFSVRKKSFYHPYIEPYNASIILRLTIMNSTITPSRNHLRTHRRPYLVLFSGCAERYRTCSKPSNCCSGRCQQMGTIPGWSGYRSRQQWVSSS